MNTEDRPPYLWDEELMKLAEEIGDIIRQQEEDDLRNYIINSRT